MSNRSKDKQEQRAIDRHKTYYKVHTFYIKTFEEYVIMEPFMGIFDNVKVVLSRELRDGVLDRMIAQYKNTKPYIFIHNGKERKNDYYYIRC